ncbi:hypothetical protein EAG_07651, partial [Camponotus floridanus]
RSYTRNYTSAFKQHIQTAFIPAHSTNCIYTRAFKRPHLYIRTRVIHSHRDTITCTLSRLYTRIKIQFLARAHVYTLAPRYTQLYT